jgi:hypothetical protein
MEKQNTYRFPSKVIFHTALWAATAPAKRIDTPNDLMLTAYVALSWIETFRSRIGKTSNFILRTMGKPYVDFRHDPKSRLYNVSLILQSMFRCIVCKDRVI